MKTFAGIVFENEHFIVVDKRAGALTIPSRFGRQDPRPCLWLELRERFGEEVAPVHRLDFEVSGIVVFARGAKAQAAAGRFFEERQVIKIYEAWTEGQAEVGLEQSWKSCLLRGKKRAYESPHGKWSETQARVTAIRDWEGRSVVQWEVRPRTGRPHQIRFHLSQAGFPIVGDRLYGSQVPWVTDAIALRAVELRFPGEGVPRMGLPSTLRVVSLEEATSIRSRPGVD